MILCSKWKNGLCKIVTKSQVVTKFNVTKSRLHSIWDIFEKSPHHISIVHVARNCSISRKECKTWPENETGLSFKRPFFTSFGEFIIGVDLIPHF